MSGMTIPLFSKRTFSFTNLQAGKTQTIIIAKAISSSRYTSGTLEVRLHSNSTTVASAHIYVKAYTAAPSSDDPSDVFTVSGSPVATVDISNQSSPLLLTDALSADFGSALMITVEATQDSSAVTLAAELSAVLTLKS